MLGLKLNYVSKRDPVFYIHTIQDYCTGTGKFPSAKDESMRTLINKSYEYITNSYLTTKLQQNRVRIEWAILYKHSNKKNTYEWYSIHIEQNFFWKLFNHFVIIYYLCYWLWNVCTKYDQINHWYIHCRATVDNNYLHKKAYSACSLPSTAIITKVSKVDLSSDLAIVWPHHLLTAATKIISIIHHTCIMLHVLLHSCYPVLNVATAGSAHNKSWVGALCACNLNKSISRPLLLKRGFE